jgi:hypothetical protein
MPMRRVFSAANTLLHANRLRARPVMRGNFFMFVFSRVVVGLARQKKKLKRVETFFVLIIPYWTSMYKSSMRQMQPVPADGRVVSQEVMG